MSRFFVFPLSLLAMQLEEKDILQHAISHAVMRAGNGTSADTIDDDRIEDFVKKHGGEKKIGYRKSDAHDQAVRGCVACNVKSGSMPNIIKQDSTVNEFVRKHEAVHGAGPLVFIGAKLLWECLKGEFKWKDFTTLCAVNSIIGRKKTPVLIRRSLITARQMGFKTPVVMNLELPKLDPKKPHREPLTTKELRLCLDRLETRKLFVRCQVGMRRVYFGKGITREELRHLLRGMMSRKPSLQSIRAEDRKLFSGQGHLIAEGPMKGQ